MGKQIKQSRKEIICELGRVLIPCVLRGKRH